MSETKKSDSQGSAGVSQVEVQSDEPVAWQYREKMPNGSWGIWRHCDIVREDPNLDYRPLFLGAAQAQTGCGDPSCKDPNCTYGSGPTEAQIERGRQAVRDEYGSKLCFWAEDGTRHCRIEADQLCMCAEIATHCLSAAIPSASRGTEA